ncbi:hypothetical protein B296_00041230 [Ensete ventricosum]|uniref:Uncharacterized protein n=1 Tax=Ensete ventricosum TaxID=4639 RepID=A0A426XJV1_ENSVE|nr:hypothetical protein B296_00041230 [Ensete ventricosum]
MEEYLQDGGFVGQAEGQGLQFDGPAGDPHGELLVEELRREEEVLLGGAGAELHHVAQAHPGLLHASPALHLVGQRLGERLRRFFHRHGREYQTDEAGGGGPESEGIDRGWEEEEEREGRGQIISSGGEEESDEDHKDRILFGNFYLLRGLFNNTKIVAYRPRIVRRVRARARERG